MNDRCEEVISHLTGPCGYTVQDLVDALQIPRYRFYNWRASTKAARREALAQKLIELYPKCFENSEFLESPPQDDLGRRYIKMLETNLEEAKQQIAELKAENKGLLEEIRRTLSQMQQKLNN